MNLYDSSFLFNAINYDEKDYISYSQQYNDDDKKRKYNNSDKHDITQKNIHVSESLLNLNESNRNSQLINDKCQSLIDFLEQYTSCPIKSTLKSNKKWMNILKVMFGINENYINLNLNHQIKTNFPLKLSNRERKKIEKLKLNGENDFNLLNVLESINKKISKQLKESVKDGIPNSLRGIIWKTIIDPLDTDFEILQLEIVDRIKIDNENNSDDEDSDECKKSDFEYDFSPIYHYSDEFSNSNNSHKSENNSKHMVDELLSSYSNNDHDFKTNLINYLSSQANLNVVEDINKDINRTLIQFPQIQNESIKKSLRNVLAAYSVIDKELGYTQGMAFLAGILLFYMDECSAFNSFCILMLSQRFRLREYFIQGFPKVIQMNNIWQIALKEYFPEIYRKLNSHKVDPIIYTLGWWMTAFTCFQFNTDILLLIFDRYLLFGSSSLISFGLTIIGIYYDYLISSSIDDVISLLQNPCNYSKINDIKYVKNLWNKKYFISKKMFKKIMKKVKIC